MSSFVTIQLANGHSINVPADSFNSLAPGLKAFIDTFDADEAAAVSITPTKTTECVPVLAPQRVPYGCCRDCWITGTKKGATYGLEGTVKPIACAVHGKEKGMIQAKILRAQNSPENIAFPNLPLAPKKSTIKKHQLCKETGCQNQGLFYCLPVGGAKKIKFCGAHKTAEMKNVYHWNKELATVATNLFPKDD